MSIDVLDMHESLACTAHRFRLVEMMETRQFAEQSAIQALMLEGENLVVCEPI
jgi:hypothetical protein